jgi:HSP20 family molecular chaperone IbpA
VGRALIWTPFLWVSGLAAQTIPTPADVLGYDLGERFTSSGAAFEYAQQLAAASPRAELQVYGETPEGRPLILLILAREDRLSDLDGILARNARLIDPALSDSEVAAIAGQNPAIAWFGYGVHGDESSSTEAALWTAYDLAAGAPGAAGILDSLIVVIDPVMNPDGRARYVNWYRSIRGAEPNPSPGTLEHRPPWPRGRYNHYLFELNRDWAWSTQAETRQRLQAWFDWRPQVHVDFHEMSPNSTYFFFPATPPINPIYPQYTLRWASYFGEAIARAFDERRWLYYSGESFDLFYPGYGDSWPSLWGAIGMTFEQAGGGSAGLAYERDDGRVLTLRDRASRHRVAGLSTLQAAAGRKTELLREFAGFHRSPPVAQRDVFLVPGRDSSAHELVTLLKRQGLQVERSARPVRVEAAPYPGYRYRGQLPAGTYRVSGDQPGWRLARTLLQANTPWDTTSRQFSYDLTAWSLPYAFGVEAHTANGAPAGAFERVGASAGARGSEPVTDAYGFLALPGLDAAGAVYRYLALGGRVRAIAEPFRLERRDWPRGTFFIPADDSAADRLSRSGLAAHVTPVRTGRAAGGVDLGTRSALTLRAPRIAVLAGDAVGASGFGDVWHFLERRVGIPFDALPAESLSPDRLRTYDVLVLPPGGPLPEERRDVIAEWTRAGGLIVALGSSAGWVGRELADIATRERDTTDVSELDRRRRALFTREERRIDRWEGAITGIVLPTATDPDHPIAWGAQLANEDGQLFVLHREDRLFEPEESIETVVYIPGPEAVAGVVSERKLAELEGGRVRRQARHAEKAASAARLADVSAASGSSWQPDTRAERQNGVIDRYVSCPIEICSRWIERSRTRRSPWSPTGCSARRTQVIEDTKDSQDTERGADDSGSHPGESNDRTSGSQENAEEAGREQARGWSPWTSFTEIQDTVSDMVDSALRGVAPIGGGRPRYDLVQVPEEGYWVLIDLPGVEKADLEVRTVGDELTVSGRRRRPDLPDGSEVRRSERGFGHFRRTLRLPADVVATGIKAKLESGVLRVTLPRRAESAEVQVEVET